MPLFTVRSFRDVRRKANWSTRHDSFTALASLLSPPDLCHSTHIMVLFQVKSVYFHQAEKYMSYLPNSGIPFARISSHNKPCYVSEPTTSAELRQFLFSLWTNKCNGAWLVPTNWRDVPPSLTIRKTYVTRATCLTVLAIISSLCSCILQS